MLLQKLNVPRLFFTHRARFSTQQKIFAHSFSVFAITGLQLGKKNPGTARNLPHLWLRLQQAHLSSACAVATKRALSLSLMFQHCWQTFVGRAAPRHPTSLKTVHVKLSESLLNTPRKSRQINCWAKCLIKINRLHPTFIEQTKWWSNTDQPTWGRAKHPTIDTQPAIVDQQCCWNG